jgi:hypothetical protein
LSSVLIGILHCCRRCVKFGVVEVRASSRSKTTFDDFCTSLRNQSGFWKGQFESRGVS